MRNIYFRKGLFLFFIAFGKILWAQQAQLLKDINPVKNEYYNKLALFYYPMPTTGNLFFVGNGCHETPEVYSLDENDQISIPANIKLDNDFDEFYCGGDPLLFAERPSILWSEGNKVFFRAEHKDTGTELWSTDGTFKGTQLVKDFRPGPESGFPVSAEKFKGSFWLNARDDTGNISLWTTDGTPQGTIKRDDIMPVQSDVYGVRLAAADNYLFLLKVLKPIGNGLELWQTDGTGTGTKLIRKWSQPMIYIHNFQVFNNKCFLSITNTQSNRIDAYCYNSPEFQEQWYATYPLTNFNSDAVKNIVQWNGKYYYTAENAASGLEVYETDGTLAGTRLFSDLKPGPESSLPYELFVFNNKLLTFANFNGKHHLVRFENSSGDYSIVTTIDDEKPYTVYHSTVEMKGHLYYSHNGRLFKTDGTPGNIFAVPGEYEGVSSWLMVHRNRIYFISRNNDIKSTIWKYDGIDTHTPEPITIGNPPLGNSSNPSPFVLLDGEAAYWAYDDEHGYQIRTSGGDPVTTASHPVIPKKSYMQLTPVSFRDTALMFLIFNETINNFQLWRYNKPSGTASAFFDFPPGEGGTPSILNGQSVVYFTTYGKQLFRTDGTSSGTAPIADNIKSIVQIVDFQNYKWITVIRKDSFMLVRTDGTEAGTSIKSVIGPFTYSVFTVAGVVENNLFFFSRLDNGRWALRKIAHPDDDPVTVFEMDAAPVSVAYGTNAVLFSVNGQLWRSDGNSTTQIPQVENAAEILSFKNEFLFSAYTPETGTELWITDSTSEGAHLVKDMERGFLGTSPQTSKGLVYNDVAYFAAFTLSEGMELWKTDGTTEGTKLATDVCAGPCSGQPDHFTLVSSHYLLFHAFTPETSFEPWILDITQPDAPARPLKPGCSIHSEIYPNPAHGRLTTVAFPDNTGQITRYKTLDASGKTTAEGSIAPSAVSIDIHLQGVPNGLYFIQLLDNSGEVFCTQRLVVQQ